MTDRVAIPREANEAMLEAMFDAWKDASPIGFEDFRAAYNVIVASGEPIPDAHPQNADIVGWLESPHGKFRANPLCKVCVEPTSTKWQIPLYMQVNAARAAPFGATDTVGRAEQPSPAAPNAKLVESAKEVRRVANLVKETQPIWSGHLLVVCDAIDAQIAKESK